jgi:NADPH-dependent 2,4-dienoyl-CoA reductase/sulfur reductase-like enzyme/nitrite reductase/ring-hydroxylating ferredoxin subunit
VNGTTVLLIHTARGKFYATSPKCTHYGVPLKGGVLNGDRLTCPAHGACFNVCTGDIEDAPAVDALVKYEVNVKGDQVFISIPPSSGTASGRRIPHLCAHNSSKDGRTFIILGGGAAGLVAAQTLREDGFQGKIVLVSKEAFLPYDRIKLSKNLAITVAEILLRPAEFFEKNDIETILGDEAVKLDKELHTLTLASGKTIAYDAVLIATGGDARTLPCEGHDLPNIFALRVPSDSEGINKASATAKNVVIIGSSFIGMEAAACLKAKKNIEKIVVVGMEKVPFERVLGEQVGAALQKLHESRGIEFRMQAVLKRYIGEDGKLTAVELNTGEVLPCDLVVIGAGIIPATGFLKGVLPLERDGSIIVDAGFKAEENIYVAGDIARFPYWATKETIRIEHWDVAQQQGRIAAHNMAGKSAVYSSVPFFWTVQFGSSVRYAGNAMSWDKFVLKGDVEGLKFAGFFVRNNTILAVVTIGADPIAAAVAELIHDNKLPPADAIEAHPDRDHILSYLKKP